MADASIDTSELEKWEKRMLNAIQTSAPQETKKITRKAGQLLQKNVKRSAKNKVKEKSGELKNSFRTRMISNNEVEVHSKKYYARFVNDGHVARDGSFVEGKFFMEDGLQTTEEELPDLLKELLHNVAEEMGVDVEG